MTIIVDTYKGTSCKATISWAKDTMYRVTIFIPSNDHIIDASNTIYSRIYPTRDKAMAAIRQYSKRHNLQLKHCGI